MAFVSIIVKVWNALDHVRLCLGTLREHTGYSCEIIVVDNGSRPEVVAYLRKLAPADARIRLIENPANLGPGQANRQGAAVARGDLLCLLDSDVLVPHGWLDGLVTAMERQPEVKLLVPLQQHQALPHPFEDTSTAQAWFATKAGLAQRQPRQQFYAYSRGLSIDEFAGLMVEGRSPDPLALTCPPAFAGTCCALLEAAFVNAAGGVADPLFAGYGSEDVDLCWRIAGDGGRVARCPTVYVHHFHNASMIDNQIDPEAALAAANRLLYAQWRAPLLAWVQAALAAGAAPRDYLSTYYIFGPLARHTDFIRDLRLATGRSDIPDQVTWRPSL
jgi:GT2 family glycosyltransferase